ncbi:hypothetical protein [Methanosphaera sp. WGK6]|uniref:hypothetical protein n=1 Tax=Methanosphaera sp. WGK6 TaxID=1561964 RepID=UPI00084CC51F|nr:hypothetical protein [Methanosphaera sp. WGK6]OED29544.1 hypothetical protein NL43_07590 [Methanosphaera sp. WGK6]
MEFNKCTCVKVNKEKMDMVKAKGLNLQDLLDKAMDEELNLNNISNKKQRITEIDEEIAKITKKRDKALADCQKKIDILMKNLIESKNHEEETYNKEIKLLELEKKLLETQLE